MKVLWITNVELPFISNYFGRPVYVGGWLHQTSELLSSKQEIELHVASPSCDVYKKIEIHGISFYSFSEDDSDSRISEIIQSVHPDVLHIWGTEYYHSLAAMKVAEKESLINKTVVSIQGLTYFYSKYHYEAFLPTSVVSGFTFKDLLKVNNIRIGKRKMMRSGKNEIQVLKKSKKCIGRTDWDYACANLVNSNIEYYYCNEILRKGFYNAQWSFEKCNKHSIFFSQTSYPIKGFHLALEAFAIVKERYPDLKVRALGRELRDEFGSFVRDDSYRRYLRKLIKKNNLSNNITWLGHLSEEEMIKEYCSANIFVSSSSIENSSNSIGEAMLLGVPVIASDVGGIKSMMKHGEEGIIYQSDAPYMLAHHIIELFENSDYAIELGRQARERALKDHDQKKIIDRIIEIYRNLQ